MPALAQKQLRARVADHKRTRQENDLNRRDGSSYRGCLYRLCCRQRFARRRLVGQTFLSVAVRQQSLSSVEQTFQSVLSVWLQKQDRQECLSYCVHARL